MPYKFALLLILLTLTACGGKTYNQNIYTERNNNQTLQSDHNMCRFLAEKAKQGIKVDYYIKNPRTFTTTGSVEVYNSLGDNIGRGSYTSTTTDNATPLDAAHGLISLLNKVDQIGTYKRTYNDCMESRGWREYKETKKQQANTDSQNSKNNDKCAAYFDSYPQGASVYADGNEGLNNLKFIGKTPLKIQGTADYITPEKYKFEYPGYDPIVIYRVRKEKKRKIYVDLTLKKQKMANLKLNSIPPGAKVNSWLKGDVSTSATFREVTPINFYYDNTTYLLASCYEFIKDGYIPQVICRDDEVFTNINVKLRKK